MRDGQDRKEEERKTAAAKNFATKRGRDSEEDKVQGVSKRLPRSLVVVA